MITGVLPERRHTQAFVRVVNQMLERSWRDVSSVVRLEIMADSTDKKRMLLHLGVLSSVLFLACFPGIPKNPPREVAAQQSPTESQRSEFGSYPNLGLIATDPKASEV